MNDPVRLLVCDDHAVVRAGLLALLAKLGVDTRAGAVAAAKERRLLR
ncbi:hypothetical protein GCM10010193_10100 [Kitasatospora atroaurantiaca]|uniref:Response regulatory domain-containing protein n=1 Tax=Kitasatospora atroaurantiaca TaxID=285545 RepID=A0A561ES83_9ACTN|nr:hypothetical protein [Kitasatospora atroaurantiaca]TWE18459.1 hypothetical protein FB465_3535 [Kitasatospora atroaurantiaca]